MPFRPIFHIFVSMNKELQEYVEREIVPRYETFDAAHRVSHVRYVIEESLRLAQFYDVDEDMVYEDGKYYPMMHVVPEEDTFWSNKDPHTIEVCEMYGPILLKNGNPVLRKFLVWQHKMLMQILTQLNEQVSSEKIERRIEEVKHQLWCNESAYSILGAIKDAGI